MKYNVIFANFTAFASHMVPSFDRDVPLPPCRSASKISYDEDDFKFMNAISNVKDDSHRFLTLQLRFPTI